MAAIEGSLLPRYYIKSNATSRASTVTPAADSGTGVVLASIPLEVGSFEIEFVGLFRPCTGNWHPGIRNRWGFTGTVANPVRNCLGPGDNR